MRHRIPTLLIIMLVATVLTSRSLVTPQFVDEQFYVWGGTYILDKVIARNFDPTPGSNPDLFPGWNPHQWWFSSSPQGFRLIYASIAKVAGLPVPDEPFDWSRRLEPQPAAVIPTATLLTMRAVAILSATYGLSMLGLRFGWSGAIAVGLWFALRPVSHWSLHHAMAEGPLLLGLGLCVSSYGTRWFGLACGFAASCKLTALGAWPLLLIRGSSGGGRHERLVGIGYALALWTVINPGSWFAGGPLYLINQTLFRVREQAELSVIMPNAATGFYFSPWYTLAPEFGLVTALAAGLNLIWRRLYTRVTHADTDGLATASEC